MDAKVHRPPEQEPAGCSRVVSVAAAPEATKVPPEQAVTAEEPSTLGSRRRSPRSCVEGPGGPVFLVKRLPCPDPDGAKQAVGPLALVALMESVVLGS